MYFLLHMRHAAADDLSTGPAQDEIDCDTGYLNFEEQWDQDKKAICCDLYGRACSHVSHVGYHPKVVYHPRQYNCHAGFSNWYFGWSQDKKTYCCHFESRGCPGTWHGSYHLNTHIGHHVGHAHEHHEHIYDCDAGFTSWMQDWSDSKKDWCCSHEQKGCVKYHCTGDDVPWALESDR